MGNKNVLLWISLLSHSLWNVCNNPFIENGLDGRKVLKRIWTFRHVNHLATFSATFSFHSGNVWSKSYVLQFIAGLKLSLVVRKISSFIFFLSCKWLFNCFPVSILIFSESIETLAGPLENVTLEDLRAFRYRDSLRGDLELGRELTLHTFRYSTGFLFLVQSQVTLGRRLNWCLAIACSDLGDL